MMHKDFPDSTDTALCNGAHGQDLEGLLYLNTDVFGAEKEERDDG